MILKSKALKKFTRFFKRDFEDFGFWMGCYYRFICPVIDFKDRYVERIGRSLAFARMAWLNYDFDSAYLWKTMAFKLKRIEKCLINGHAIQEKEHMDALRESIEILERLFGEDYDHKYHEAHSAKWGELEMCEFVPHEVDEKGKAKTYRSIFKDRANVKTEEDKVLEREEFRKCFELGEADRENDMNRLFLLLKNHSRTWWD